MTDRSFGKPLSHYHQDQPKRMLVSKRVTVAKGASGLGVNLKARSQLLCLNRNTFVCCSGCKLVLRFGEKFDQT